MTLDKVESKLEIILQLVESMASISNQIKKLKNYPFDEILIDIRWAIDLKFTNERGIKYLMNGAVELNEYVKRSRNTWIKERASLVVELLEEMLEGNYTIAREVKKKLKEPFPLVEKKVELVIRSIQVDVSTDTKCPTCSYLFAPNEIIEYTALGYRCPKCRQVIRKI